MMLLVSGTTKFVFENRDNPHLGILLTPADGQSLSSIRNSGLPFAADNSAYSNWSAERYMKMLRKMQGGQPLWVTVPDVVGDMAQTLCRWQEWSKIVREHGFSPALVAQDGADCCRIPWDEFTCLFVGGTTEFKEGPVAEQMVRQAKRLGKWVHMGRVNTRKRIRLARRWGVDSIDGTSFSWWSRTLIPKAIRWMTEPFPPLQGDLFRESACPV